ncbi:MAG: transposase, partial [Desulfobacula sp.]|nr:transposase [Desulfobacula sp.]
EIVIKYIYKATEIKTSKVVEAIDPITKKGGELAMTTAEKLRQEGRQEGKQEGVQLGTYNTYFNLIQNMKKNNIPEAEIAKLMNLELSIIKKIANKEEVEIPLHLLDSDL